MSTSISKNFIIGLSIIIIPIIWFVYYAIFPFFLIVAIDDPVVGLPTLVKSREIVSVNNHKTQGTVSLLHVVDNKYVLRYENFFTDNCPDMHVLLSKDLNAQDYIDLGPSLGTAGNINYVMPDDINITNYKYSLYWCNSFRSLFNYADISLP